MKMFGVSDDAAIIIFMVILLSSIPTLIISSYLIRQYGIPQLGVWYKQIQVSFGRGCAKSNASSGRAHGDRTVTLAHPTAWGIFDPRKDEELGKDVTIVKIVETVAPTGQAMTVEDAV